MTVIAKEKNLINDLSIVNTQLHELFKNDEIQDYVVIFNKIASSIAKQSKQDFDSIKNTLLDNFFSDNLSQYNDSQKAQILIFAASYGRTNIVQNLIDSAIDAEELDINEETALEGAARNGHLDTVKLLVDHIGEGVENDALPPAAESGHISIIKFLLDNYNIDKGTIISGLWLAASNGHLELSNLLMELCNGSNINTFLDGAIFIDAAHSGHFDIVKALLDRNFDIEQNIKNQALWRSAEHGHALVVELLLQSGANIDYQWYFEKTPLIVAAEHEHFDVIKILLKNNADKNIRDDIKRTAKDAAKENSKEIAKYISNYVN